MMAQTLLTYYYPNKMGRIILLAKICQSQFTNLYGYLVLVPAFGFYTKDFSKHMELANIFNLMGCLTLGSGNKTLDHFPGVICMG